MWGDGNVDVTAADSRLRKCGRSGMIIWAVLISFMSRRGKRDGNYVGEMSGRNICRTCGGNVSKGISIDRVGCGGIRLGNSGVGGWEQGACDHGWMAQL